MTKSRWLAMAILAGLAGILIVSSASGQRLIGTFSAVIFDYEVSDEDGISFATEFERLGGVDTLGHPASYRFQLGDGFIYQLTQGALLQWRPEVGRAFLGNTFELLQQAGLDGWLLRAKGNSLTHQERRFGRRLGKSKGDEILLANERQD